MIAVRLSLLLFLYLSLSSVHQVLSLPLRQRCSSTIRIIPLPTSRLYLRPQNSRDRNEFDPEIGDDIDNNDDKKSKRNAGKEPSVRRPTVINNLNRWEVINRALLAGAFVAGIGAGITVDSAINTNPRDLASRDAIDRSAPNPKICQKYGSSAMVLDQRVFVTFNPFNVYVTQADTKPGCVLRNSNVVQQLQVERSLVSPDEMEACKNSFNTWVRPLESLVIISF